MVSLLFMYTQEVLSFCTGSHIERVIHIYFHFFFLIELLSTILSPGYHLKCALYLKTQIQ